MMAAQLTALGRRAGGHVGGLWVPKIGFLDGFAFVIPLVRFVQFDVVGRLYLTELLLAGMLPLLAIHRGPQLFRGRQLTVIGLLSVWLLAQVGTDLILSTSFRDYARGWSRIGFTLINFCAIYMLLYGNTKRLVLFGIGAALGDVIAYFVSPTIHAATYPWKFGYGSGITWLLVLLAVVVGRNRGLGRLWPAVILLLGSFLDFYMGARGGGGIMFLASFYVAAQVIQGRSTRSSLKLRQLAIVGGVVVFATLGVLQLYEHFVQAGWLGEDALQKYEMQIAGDYGLLLGGRSEILVSSLAILDSPLIGHGSWAKNCHYSSLYVQLKQQAGYSASEEHEDCLIPAHSYLMGTWVEAGILGAIFWVWVLGLSIRVLTHIYIARNRLAPLVVFVVFTFMWDILFSPFAAWARFMVPYYIVLMLSQLPSTHNVKSSRPHHFGLAPSVH